MKGRSLVQILAILVFLSGNVALGNLSQKEMEEASKAIQQKKSAKVLKKGTIVKLRGHQKPITFKEGFEPIFDEGNVLFSTSDLSESEVEYMEPNYYFENLIPNQKYLELIDRVSKSMAPHAVSPRNTDYSKEPRIKLNGKVQTKLELGQLIKADASRSYTLDDSPLNFRWSVLEPGAPKAVTASKKPVLEYTPTQRGTYTVTLTLSNEAFPDTVEELGDLAALLGLLGSVQQRIYSEVRFTVDVSQFKAIVIADSKDPEVLYTELGKTVQLNASLSKPHPQYDRTGVLDHLWAIPNFMFFNLAAPYSQFRKFDTSPYESVIRYTPDALGGYYVQDEMVDDFGVRQTKTLIIDVTKNEVLASLPYDPTRPDALRPLLYQHDIIKTYDAWKEMDLSKASEVVVAVIDTGVNINHPDLNANMWVNKAELNGLPGVDDDGNGYVDDVNGWDFTHNDNSPFDDGHHGSHVSGIIAAVAGNGGVVGVAPNVKIMPIKGLFGFGSGELADLTNAIYYAADNGAHIINASWGGQMEELAESKALKEAITYAQNKGVLFVAAAGNETLDNDQIPMMPASYDVDGILSVAATTPADTLASFSNVGKTSVDVGAPGTNIISTISWNPERKGYEAMSGTSMATPVVAGVAALAKSLKPDLTNRELKELIMKTGDELRSLQEMTVSGRRVNALNLVKEIKKLLQPAEETTPPVEIPAGTRTI
ncbi:MAG: S8 family serine peptidase [Deltaproteobacteria bacterium]|nr:S8 family serine peptidase [Deltaproteobacteria bacterium]